MHIALFDVLVFIALFCILEHYAVCNIVLHVHLYHPVLRNSLNLQDVLHRRTEPVKIKPLKNHYYM